MKKNIQNIRLTALLLALLLAFTACTSQTNPTNTPTASPTATPNGSGQQVSPAPTDEPGTPTETPTSTPSPTPTQTEKEELLSYTSETSQKAVFAQLNTFSFDNTSVEFYTLGDNLVFVCCSYYDEYEAESSDYSLLLYNMTTGKIEEIVEYPNLMSLNVYQVDENHLLVADYANEKYIIYNEKLEEEKRLPLEGRMIYSDVIVDYESNILYYINNNELGSYNIETAEFKTLYTFPGEVYLNCRSVEDGVLMANGYMEDLESGLLESCFVYFDLKNNELLDTNWDCTQKYYSQDGSEYVYVDLYFHTIVQLYETNGDVCKSSIKFVTSTETMYATLDWTNRVVLTVNPLSGSDGYYNELRCYSIDTGELISDCILKKGGEYLDSGLCFDTVGLYVINGLIPVEVTEYGETYTEYKNCLYFWDYMNDGVEAKDDIFIRQSNVTQTFSDRVEKLRRRLQDKYGIYVYLGYEIAPVEFTYQLLICQDDEMIYDTLLVVEEVFAEYPDDFFAQLKVGSTRTLGVYLCDGFIKTDEYSAENAIALATSSNYERILALDVNYSYEMEGTVYHEVSHWIDTIISADELFGSTEGYTEGWDALNPLGYTYLNSYLDYYDNYKYTFEDFGNVEEAYFTDPYSTTFAGEDRARLFEKLMCDENNDYWRSDHIIAKLEFYFEYIRKAFNDEKWPEKTRWELKLEEWKQLNENYKNNPNSADAAGGKG